MPSDIIYLVDCSGSMAKGKGMKGLEGSKLDAVRGRLSALFADAGAFGACDRVALLSFRQRSLDAAEVLELAPLQPAGSPGPLMQALDRIRAMGAEGGTPLGAALRHALAIHAPPSDSTKGIMLITDGPNSIGEDPRLAVYDALAGDVRIDAVGLGSKADAATLGHISRKTGGMLTIVSDAAGLPGALRWRLTSAPLPADVSAAVESAGRIRLAMSGADAERSRGGIKADEHFRRTSALQSELDSLAQQFRDRRARASQEYIGLRLERDSAMAQLADLNRAFRQRSIEKNGYLERASPLEDRVAGISREIAVRRAILDLPA